MEGKVPAGTKIESIYGPIWIWPSCRGMPTRMMPVTTTRYTLDRITIVITVDASNCLDNATLYYRNEPYYDGTAYCLTRLMGVRS